MTLAAPRQQVAVPMSKAMEDHALVAAHAQAALEEFDESASVASDDSELLAAQRIAARKQEKKKTVVNKVRGRLRVAEWRQVVREHKDRPFTPSRGRRRAFCAA